MYKVYGYSRSNDAFLGFYSFKDASISLACLLDVLGILYDLDSVYFHICVIDDEKKK